MNVCHASSRRLRRFDLIANVAEYEKARDELRSLENRLTKLLQTHEIGVKGFTKAGIRKMIARLPSTGFARNPMAKRPMPHPVAAPVSAKAEKSAQEAKNLRHSSTKNSRYSREARKRGGRRQREMIEVISWN